MKIEPARARQYQFIAVLVTALIVSAAYVGLVNFAVVHQPNQLVVGWSDSQFSGRWSESGSAGTPGYISISNGTLSVGAVGTARPGVIITAVGLDLPSLNVGRYPYLAISVKSPSEYLAIRIVLSYAPGQALMVVLSTFNDQNWHTIYANLVFLGFSGQVPVNFLEIGWMAVQQPVGPNPVVQFQNLSLVAFSGS
ncbi:MAG: hypothetical protein WB778_08195 [Thermoplasmata archaeon]